MKTPSAVPRLFSGTRLTASTPMAGKTSEKPNPPRAAPAIAIHGECACHSRSSPSDSTERQTMATGNPPKRLMVWMKSRRASNERHAKSRQAERGAVPVAAGIEERDEGGQHAVADSAQRQAHAVRGNAAQHVAEGKMLAVNNRNRRLCGRPGRG